MKNIKNFKNWKKLNESLDDEEFWQTLGDLGLILTQEDIISTIKNHDDFIELDEYDIEGLHIMVTLDTNAWGVSSIDVELEFEREPGGFKLVSGLMSYYCKSTMYGQDPDIDPKYEDEDPEELAEKLGIEDKAEVGAEWIGKTEVRTIEDIQDILKVKDMNLSPEVLVPSGNVKVYYNDKWGQL